MKRRKKVRSTRRELNGCWCESSVFPVPPAASPAFSAAGRGRGQGAHPNGALVGSSATGLSSLQPGPAPRGRGRGARLSPGVPARVGLTCGRSSLDSTGTHSAVRLTLSQARPDTAPHGHVAPASERLSGDSFRWTGRKGSGVTFARRGSGTTEPHRLRQAAGARRAVWWQRTRGGSRQGVRPEP